MGFLPRWFARQQPAVADPAHHTFYAKQLMGSLLAMAWFVEARDPYTGGHLWRVSRYSRLLADALQLPEADAARISLGGFLHDLGKVGVPDAILRKPDRLSDDEYAVIRTHPDIGLRMLAGHALATLVRHAVGLHHERPDGAGYPRGLQGAHIPLDARIVGLCDAFDAMTSRRPYREAMPRDTALAILQQEAGRQFDAALVEVFLQLGQQGALDHVMGHSDDGIPLQTCPMCGPTLVVQRDSQPGMRLYCRSCSGEFELQKQNGAFIATPTGRMGSAQDLEPEADVALIARMVESVVAALPLDSLLVQSSEAA